MSIDTEAGLEGVKHTLSDEGNEHTRTNEFGTTNAWQAKLKMKLQYQQKQSRYKNLKSLVKSTTKPIHDRNEPKPPLPNGRNHNKDLTPMNIKYHQSIQ